MPSDQECAQQEPSGSQRIDLFTRVTTAVALLLRLLIAFAVYHAKPATWFYSQASELGELAHSVATGQGISAPFGGSTGPSAFLSPGYPLFVGGLFRALGIYSREAELVLFVAQACFGAITVLLLMLVARRLFGRTTARISGILVALHPWLISLGLVFWETSFSLMMLTALVYVSIRCMEESSYRMLLCAALVGSLGIAVNASLALTTIALFIWVTYTNLDVRKRAARPAFLFVFLFSVWPVRNAFVMHAFIPLRDNLGYELWQGNRPGADGFFAPELHPNTNKVQFHRFQQLGELGYMREKSSEAKEWIAKSPVHFLELTSKRVGFFWLGVSRQHYGNQICIASITSLAGFTGLILFLRRRRLDGAMPLIIPFALFPIPYYITHPDFRFWCLLSPLLTALGVYAFACMTDPNTHRAPAPQMNGKE